jgi:hypothetical protein
MSEASVALQEIDRQRVALAAKVRLPWWYACLFALTMLGLLGLPLINRFTSSEVSTWAVLWPAVIVSLLSDLVLGHVTGAKLARGTLRAYPSTRPAGLSMLAVGVVGIVGANWLVDVGQPAQAVVLAVICTVASVRCLVWQTAGIRKDIRTGRALTS